MFFLNHLTVNLQYTQPQYMFISSPIPHNNFPSCLVNINIISYLLRRKANAGLPVSINESRQYPFCTAGQYGKKAKCDWLCSPSNANIISQILAWFLQKIQRKKRTFLKGSSAPLQLIFETTQSFQKTLGSLSSHLIYSPCKC